jgi:hypothetical protein
MLAFADQQCNSPADWPMSEFESMHLDPPGSRVVFFGDSDIAVSTTCPEHGFFSLVEGRL